MKEKPICGKKKLIYYRNKILNTAVCYERTKGNVLLFPVSLYRISLNSMWFQVSEPNTYQLLSMYIFVPPSNNFPCFVYKPL